jgi:uncharacterized protein (TIGR00730 family)
MSSSPKPQPRPTKAYKNLDFLNSSAARHIRILCELQEPAKRFREMGVENTIIFFGSARIPCSNVARQRLEEAEKGVKEGKPDDEALARRLRVAQRHMRASVYHDKTIELAREMALWSATIPERERRFHICTGGGFGMMEAANRGAHEAGQTSVGLGISLPFEPEPNPFATPELQFEFHYFMIRKYWFAYLAKAMVVTPGGFGTMDELFEILTLRQTGKTSKPMPTVLLGSEFWNDILRFEAFVEWGVISEDDLHLFRIFDDVGEARDFLVNELTKHYLEPYRTGLTV